MVPHLRFYFHELVRAAAAEILPHLLECVQSKGQAGLSHTHTLISFCNITLIPMVCLTPGVHAVQLVWSHMSDKLLEAINMEPDPEIVGIMMDSLCKVSAAQ